MKTYTSFIEIEKDLKKLELEREIANEELKIVKHNFEDILEPMNWINSAFKMISKYGVLLMIKKILK
ncbi:hypothetical protein [Polaribacter sp. Asnod6-C07]|uniref:hypothetical protein n=1 Tax=Polaribacter sp. Asnod6-C07 TaxID=3160582 RepID=UPI00386826D8